MLLLVEFMVLLWWYVYVVGKGVVEVVVGVKIGGKGNIQDGFVGIVQQCLYMIDMYGGYVLFYGLLYYLLKDFYCVVWVEFYVFGNGIDGQCLVVVGSDKFQYLVDIKLCVV